MTLKYTLPLYDNMATLENVGGKGMSLSKLIGGGIPVPNGFHVTTDAYKKYVQGNNIGAEINDLLRDLDPTDTEGLEKASEKIAEIFKAGTIPEELLNAITAAYEQMQNATVAVRSSGTAEDLPGASFAGQHESYLNIQGTNDVIDAVKRCWASLWTARAISYRLLNDIDQESVSLAVVVQKLVYSDASGVMFTANPTNGKRNEILINTAWGLGEAIVSSLVTPDTAIVDKSTGKILSLDIADKQVMTVRTSGGSTEKAVAEHLRKKASLTKGQIVALAGLGKEIEEYYHMPMDVEWALEKGKLYIVQARPITIMPPEWILPEKNAIYSKASLAEHLPNPVTPLFATLGMQSVNKAAKILWKHMFGKSVPKLWPKHGAYTVINGYVYFSVIFKPLLIAVKSLSPRSIREGMKNSVPRYEAAQKVFGAEVKHAENRSKQQQLPVSELLFYASELFDKASIYFTNIQLCLPAAMTSETMLRKFYHKAASRLGISDMSVFLLGFDTAVLDGEKSLYKIAELVKTNSELCSYISKTPADKIDADLDLPMPPNGVDPIVWQEWEDNIIKHMSMFGKTCYDYDFGVPTPMEERLPTLEAIKSFVIGAGKNPFERQANAIEKRKSATALMQKHISGPRRWLFNKLLDWAQRTGAMRENAIYYMGMAHPLIRQMLGEIGAKLVSGGAISEQNDIYYLEEKELRALIGDLEKSAPLSDMQELVKSRKEEVAKNRKFASPNTLPEKSESSSKKAKPYRKDGNLVLTGIGTSAGTITAKACVLESPADFGKLQKGDVLIAVTTTPAWTPLFALAGAVITDIGGPLSHSSIVAREYGIPAVMAVDAATKNIKTGQTITVDGGAGTVMIHE